MDGWTFFLYPDCSLFTGLEVVWDSNATMNVMTAKGGMPNWTFLHLVFITQLSFNIVTPYLEIGDRGKADKTTPRRSAINKERTNISTPKRLFRNGTNDNYNSNNNGNPLTKTTSFRNDNPPTHPDRAQSNSPYNTAKNNPLSSSQVSALIIWGVRNYF